MEVKICPKCKKGIEPRDYVRSGPTLIGGVDPRIKCRKCGYLGLPIVLREEDEDIK